MSDYRVRITRSEDPAAEQPFHVTIEAANGEILFSSETFVNRLHAVSLGETFAAMIDGNLVDET